MSDIEVRLKHAFDAHLDPITASGSLPHDVRIRARRGRSMALVAAALASVTVVATAAVALPNVLGRDDLPIGPSEAPTPIEPKANGRIAYSLVARSGIELHTVNPDGSDDLVIPIAQGDPWLHSWSPDGSRIAVTIYPRSGGEERSLWVMNADGSDARRVASARNVSVASWSPDGTTLVFSSASEGRAHIETVSSDGTDRREIHGEAAESTFSIFSAQFSPDGTKILFDRGTDAGFDIFVMDVEGTDVTRLTTTGTDYDPSWSPDGTKIAFTRHEIIDNRATSDIFVMNSDGTDVQRLTDDDAGTSLYPTWSPDGTKIAYQRGDGGGPGDVVVMNADGSNPELLVDGDVLGISWQPLPVSGGNPEEASEDEPNEDEADEAEDAPHEEIAIDRHGCPVPISGAEGAVEEWHTDPVFVAEGTEDSVQWILCARIGSNVEGLEPGRALCLNFAYSDDPSRGLDCAFASRLGDIESEDLFAPLHAVQWGYSVGTMPRATATVTFEPRRGRTIQGELHEAPDELGMAAHFFTLFADPETAGTLIARDSEGELICRWHTRGGPLEGPGCPELSRR